MLSIDDSLEKVAMFAVDIAGLATKYEFSVYRWGCAGQANCLTTKDDSEIHRQWLAVDVELDDMSKADQFTTDCAIAGLYCHNDGQFIHIQPTPIGQPIL